MQVTRGVSFLKSNLILLGLALIIPISAAATPYSPETTSRESLKVVDVVNGIPTYAPLSGNSRDLSFQLLDDGRVFEVFASSDDTTDYDPVSDTYSGADPLDFDACVGSARENIYWVDRASGKPPVCLSRSSYRIRFMGDSAKPLIGGPAGDEGRYIVWETIDPEWWAADSDGNEFYTFLLGNRLVVHDRKWEENTFTRAQCDDTSPNIPVITPTPIPTVGAGTPTPLPTPTPTPIPIVTERVGYMGDDGSRFAFVSDGQKLIDNLSPQCSDGGPYRDVFWRDGNSCSPNSFGPCKTSVLFDTYGFHAGSNTVDLLNGHSDSVWTNPGFSIFALDTASTVPVHFLPDLLGHKDVFVWEGTAFSLITQSQIPVLNVNTGAVAFKNVAGPANAESRQPRMDASARWIVFESDATDLVLQEQSGAYSYKVPQGSASQIYLHDRINDKTALVTLDSSGAVGNKKSQNAYISQDGRFIVFESQATNLVKKHNNVDVTAVRGTDIWNIYMYDRELNEFYIVTPGVNDAGVIGLDEHAHITHVSRNGLTVAFQSRATNAITAAAPGGAKTTNTYQDVFLARNNCPDDSDGDKTPDCLDSCPLDPNKNFAGQCGCGTPETDDDGDGVANCVDLCAQDPLKVNPLQCGCGVEETNQDNDGAPDCIDGCPFTASKTAPGFCGCDKPDVDANGNGTPDCADPVAGSIPLAPRVKKITAPLGQGPRAKIYAQTTYPNANVRYVFTLKKKSGKTVRNLESAKSQVVFRNLTKRQGYIVSYVIRAGSDSTASSPTVNFRP